MVRDADQLGRAGTDRGDQDTPATAAEAHYSRGWIYDFKGNKAEGAVGGFHEEVSYRPRAEAEFKAAGPDEAGMDCGRRSGSTTR